MFQNVHFLISFENKHFLLVHMKQFKQYYNTLWNIPLHSTALRKTPTLRFEKKPFF